MFFLAQISGVIAWFLFVYSYFGKNVNKVILIQFLSDTFYALNYLFLGAWTGMIVTIFDMIKEIGYYKTDKDKYIFLFTIPIYVITSFLFEGSFLALIPIIASLLDGYATLKNKKMVVIMGIVSNALWIFYDIYYLDYMVIFSDIVLVVINISILIYGYSKFVRKNDIHVVARKSLTKDTLKKIYLLEKKYANDNSYLHMNEMKEIYEKENDSYILIKDKNIVIGYINILSITKDFYNEMISSVEKKKKKIKMNELVDYDKKIDYYLTINSIVLKNAYQNNDTYEKIVRAINRYIKKKEEKGYKIKKVCSYVNNDFEKIIIEKLKFQKIKDINNECFFYELTMGVKNFCRQKC